MKKYIISKTAFIFYMSFMVCIGLLWSCSDDEVSYSKDKIAPSIIEMPAFAEPGDVIEISGYNLTPEIYTGELSTADYTLTLDNTTITVDSVKTLPDNPSIINLWATIPATFTLGDYNLKVEVGGLSSEGQTFTVANVLVVLISDENDDVEEGQSGTMALSSVDLELCEYDTWQAVSGIDQGLQVIGLRFNGISIDRTPTIKLALIQFTCDATGSEDAEMTIYGENIGNSPAFEATDYNVSNRTKTSASVVWEIPEWEAVGDAGEEQRTDDLASIVQEILDRSDWANGNSLSFILVPSGPSEGQTSDTAGREAEAGVGDDSATLTIVYF